MKVLSKWLFKSVGLMMTMGLVVLGLFINSPGSLKAAGLTGEYNGRLRYYNPQGPEVLDSTGTTYNWVDDLWGRVSTDTAQAATDSTAINVRVTTATPIPVNFSGVPQSVKIDGTSNTVVIDPAEPVRVKIDATSNTVVVNPDEPVKVRIDGTSNTVIVDPDQPVKVRIDGTSNTVTFNGSAQPVYSKPDAYYSYASSRAVVYPNQTQTITINAAIVGYSVTYVGGSSATVVTASWGTFEVPTGFTEKEENMFENPISSAATLTCTLGENGTSYIRLSGRRELQ